MRRKNIDIRVDQNYFLRTSLCLRGNTDKWLEANCTKVEVWLRRVRVTSPVPFGIIHSTMTTMLLLVRDPFPEAAGPDYFFREARTNAIVSHQ
jgi:hypothetical protein